jgi:hypothetical protein
MSEKKCTGNHAEHMCSMMENKQFANIRKAAMDAQYMCSNCGRCSNSEENLCAPLAFDAIDPGIPLE